MINKSDYQPPFLHRLAHFSTIIPNQFRTIRGITYSRETIETVDDDFIDIDVSKIGSTQCILLLHGLEGNSHSSYMQGMVQFSNESGFDAIAMNHRSCSGRLNKQAISYHSGKTDDVQRIVDYLSKSYDSIHIVGFSLGGNIALKLAGQWGDSPTSKVKSIVGVSVPCDLESSARTLAKLENRVYLWRFLSQLKAKAKEKSMRFPEANIDAHLLQHCSSFHAFDQAYTAPVHGFKSALDYYEKSSSKQFISNIRLPTLIINARNDSFLSPECYPFAEVEANANVSLITPTYGGHVGFAQDYKMNAPFWSEVQIMNFIQGIAN